MFHLNIPASRRQQNDNGITEHRDRNNKEQNITKKKNIKKNGEIRYPRDETFASV